MGSGSTQQSGNQSAPHVPEWQQPLYKNTASQWEQAQGGLPNISQLYSDIPLLNIPGLNSGQLGAIGQFQSMGQNPGQLNQSEQNAFNTLSSFAGSAGQPSAATQAEMKEFAALQAPLVQSQSALAGQGNSGAGTEALALSQEQAAVPFLQQDQANSLSAAGGLSQLGGQQYGQSVENITNALQASGMQYDVAQQQAQALYNQQQQQQQFGQQVQMGPQSQFPGMWGGGFSSQSVTPSKF